MRAVMKASGISKEEAKANPQEVLAVLQFHIDGGPGPSQLRHKHTIRKNITQAANIKQEDFTKQRCRQNNFVLIIKMVPKAIR